MPKLRMTRDLYAVRSKETGLYMPASERHLFMLIEPEDFHPSRPRLFWTRLGALRALYAWKSKQPASVDLFTGEYDYDPPMPPNEPPANRSGEYEIVRFTLTEEEVT